MNRARKIFLLIFLFLLCTGCNKKVEKTFLLSVESDFVKYEDENLNAYTVDENGMLFTAGLIGANSDGAVDSVISTSVTYLHQYDLEGNLVFAHEFDTTIGSFNGMTVNGSKIYFTSSSSNLNGSCLSLFSYDIKTDQLERLYDFNFFETVKQLIYSKDRIYILGNKAYSTKGNVSIAKDAYQSKGEKLLYYSLNDKSAYDLEVNIPISMALDVDGTLMINAYLDSEGYCMLRYDSLNDSIKVTANFNSNKIDNFTINDQGKIIYTYNLDSRGLVMSDILLLDEESELYSDASVINYGIYFIKGQVYCMTNSRAIVRFSLNTVQKENHVLRYISAGFQADEPFGCGYTMKRTELEDDEFAVKVLSQDKDFDLFLMNSSSYTSYNISKNGVFYPLNGVKGIKEYLDSCFPYVKEVATDKDGNIWMIPIAVDIPGLLVNEESLARDNINLKNNMTYEEFYKVQDKMTSELYKKANCNPYVIYLNFFNQYFNKDQDLNNEMFRNRLEQFRKYNSIMPNIISGDIDYNEDFLYQYCRQAFVYNLILNQVKDDSSLRIYSMPKQSSSDKNIGTCSFLAVNPNSKNRKEVLAYLSDWIKYTMNQKTLPLHFKEPVPDENTLRRSLYELYKNGNIAFNIDRDVYYDGFFNVVEGGGDIDEYIIGTERKLDMYFNE